ncbi:MAG: pyruvate ferredoxin oxidoreductase [Planctomycetota bacterium]|nr:MAG: pyruvate ferredoxin oxidoreductase [Planctomycetota bacterium]
MADRKIRQVKLSLTGNEAGAFALKQANPDVAAVFPITPQTELMHAFSAYVADGAVNTEMVYVESEHSAMSATVGAAAAGARAFTATSANGLALMWEIVYIAASLRLPIVMPVINRALSGPINIHCDHSDTMGARDAGWIQIFCENSQEVYDSLLCAFRIGENKKVLLPVMVTLDGFIISHTTEVVETIERDEDARAFIGPYEPWISLLDVDNPVTMGPLDLQDYYFEHKRQQVEAMTNAPAVIDEVFAAYGELTGRRYERVEKYRTDDAEVVLMSLGSTAGTAKEAVDVLRDEGLAVGHLKVRTFRPFPFDLVREALSGAKVVGVLDRSISFGAQYGPLCTEVMAAVHGKDVEIRNFIYGLGGRDIFVEQIAETGRSLYDLMRGKKDLPPQSYIGLRE